MEPEGSLPLSQKPTADPHPEAEEPSLHPHTLFLEGPFE
jgi:hypothetical protein